MKTYINTLLILYFASFAQPTFARSLDPNTFVKTSELIKMNLDENLPAGRFIADSGTVRINRLAETISLTVLTKKAPCPQGNACTQEAAINLSVTLPLQEVFTDHCQNTIYVASKDEQHGGGALQIIEVVDHTSNICPHLIMLPEAAIYYSTEIYDQLQGGRTLRTMSRFTGSALK